MLHLVKMSYNSTENVYLILTTLFSYPMDPLILF